MMTKTEDGAGWTCRECGGLYPADRDAYDHLRDEHPGLYATLTKAVVMPVDHAPRHVRRKLSRHPKKGTR